MLILLLGTCESEQFPTPKYNKSQKYNVKLCIHDFYSTKFYLHFHIPTSKWVSKLIENVTISEDDIVRIVKSLNPNKSDGWDNLSIMMIEICDQSISYQLKLIFIDSLQEGISPKWKKANILPVHKKESKILIKSYRPIFGKIF